MARWGMPSSQFALMQSAKKRAAKLDANGETVDFKQLLRMEPDSGTTNIRNTDSKHWKRWLGVASLRRPIHVVQRVQQAGWRKHLVCAQRKPAARVLRRHPCPEVDIRAQGKEGETTNDLFGFLTTDPNKEVGAIHPKAMPVILRTSDEIDQWMTAETPDALKLQRPLPDKSLKIVLTGVKKDEAA